MTRRVPIERKIAERVRILRERQGLSQAGLAQLAHTSRSQVAMVERGDRAPTIATLERFARALGVRLSDLVGDEELVQVKQNPLGPAERLAAELEERGPEYLAALRRLLKVVDTLAKTERARRRKND